MVALAARPCSASVGVAAIEIERDVERLYTAVGADPRMASSLPAILRALALERHDGLIDVRLVDAANDAPRARLQVLGPRSAREYVIEVSNEVVARPRPAALAWLLAHEAGEWRVDVHRAADDGDALRERLANNWAGALLAPARALELAYDCWGFDLAVIAEQFDVTKRVAALRLGEALEHGVAVIDPRAEPLWDRPVVQRRGWLAGAHVADAELMRLAWDLAAAERHGWRVTRIERGVRVLWRETAVET